MDGAEWLSHEIQALPYLFIVM